MHIRGSVPLSEMGVIVSDEVILQYVGFKTTGEVRQYAFTRRESGGKSAEFFVTIASAAFVEHRVRYQDAPDICSLRLRRELTSEIAHPPDTVFSVTDAELEAYKTAHTPKSKPGTSAFREETES